ncbi:hypothetical protein GGI35DRAFT_464953 [Trichoderma velutinum]
MAVKIKSIHLQQPQHAQHQTRLSSQPHSDKQVVPETACSCSNKRPYDTMTLDDNHPEEVDSDDGYGIYIGWDSDYSDDSDAMPKKKQPKDAPILTATSLVEAGIYMGEHPTGLCQGSKDLLGQLLDGIQSPPDGSLFDSEEFVKMLEEVKHSNKEMILRKLAPQIVPSPKIACSNADTILLAAESTNEKWWHCQPLLPKKPRPAYSVGFEIGAFNEQFDNLFQLEENAQEPEYTCTCKKDKAGAKKPRRFAKKTSFMEGAPFMSFPFLSCEIGPILEGQCRNAHSMAIGMSAIVKVFRAINREGEVHGRILAFSISYDGDKSQSVAHYPVIEGENTTYHQVLLPQCSFSNPEERHIPFNFVKKLYDYWMPRHYEWLHEATNAIPERLCCQRA